MSMITIHCRLVANEDTRRQLWFLMAGKYTPLINALLEKIAQHDSFDDWCQTGSILLAVVKECCKALREEERFAGQPERFYASAMAIAKRMLDTPLIIRNTMLVHLFEPKEFRSLLVVKLSEQDPNPRDLQNRNFGDGIKRYLLFRSRKNYFFSDANL